MSFPPSIPPAPGADTVLTRVIYQDVQMAGLRATLQRNTAAVRLAALSPDLQRFRALHLRLQLIDEIEAGPLKTLAPPAILRCGLPSTDIRALPGMSLGYVAAVWDIAAKYSCRFSTAGRNISA